MGGTVMKKVASASGLGQLAEAFLLSKRVAGCTEQTLHIYGGWLTRFTQAVGLSACDAVAVTKFFAGLRSSGLAPSSVHQAYRSIKTFLRWCLDTGTKQGLVKGKVRHSTGKRIRANEDVSKLLVRWAVTDRPAAVEEELHRRYKTRHGKLPKYVKHT